MHHVWLLMQERVGSTWLASTHLQQHPEVHMLKGGQGEACFGMPFKTRREQAEDACFAQLLAHRSACKALGARVCGWKAKADFCPTSRCESWLWTHMRPIILHLYRRDVLRQAVSHVLASHSNVWTCKASSPTCHAARPPEQMADKMMGVLQYLRRRHLHRCRYLQRHVPKPWHQIAYEDVADHARRRAAIATVYNFIGVNASFHSWRDTRRRQSAEGAPVASVLGPSEQSRLIALLRGAHALRDILVWNRSGSFPEFRNMSHCDENTSTRMPVQGRRLRPQLEAMGVAWMQRRLASQGRRLSAAATACRSCGVMYCVYVREHIGTPRIITEAIASAEQLRLRMRPTYPTMLFANDEALALIRARGKLSLWSAGHRRLMLPDTLLQLHDASRTGSKGRPSPFAFKIAAMLATEWEATLFLDADLFVLEPALVHTLLTSTLRFADLAAPIVPGRHKMLGLRVAATAPGAPVLCSCLMAYRRAALPLLRDAAERLLAFSEPSMLRQGDQEYIWLAWTDRFAQEGVRVLPLAEDWYCPTEALRRYYASVGTRCQAMHQHRINLTRAVLARSAGAVHRRRLSAVSPRETPLSQVFRAAGRCSDASITINQGGPRTPPSLVHLERWVPVRHTVFRNFDPLYEANLWMYFDFHAYRQFESTDAAGRLDPTQLPPHLMWYLPNRTLFLSDSIDLARYVGQRDYNPTSPDYRSKLALMHSASRVLTEVDTIVFTHHVDKVQSCGLRCCATDHATATRRYPDYKPRNASKALDKPWHTVYYTELVALRDFRPYTCPAHPALWRPQHRPRAPRCPCTHPTVGGKALGVC